MLALAPSHKAQLINYTSWLEKLHLPYYILKDRDSIDNYSALLLCGGPDVGKVGNEQRDSNELRWFKEAYGKIPVLGICRGLQLANVALGGILYDDLDETLIKHTSNKVQIAGEPNPLLESSFHNIKVGNQLIKVNSRHHQGIKTLAEGLLALATADDGLIEMVEGKDALFVQWHPERPDVWGTEAEQIVSEWLLSKEPKRVDWEFILNSDEHALTNITAYFMEKGFTVVSEERIKKSINATYDSLYLSKLIAKYPFHLKRVKDKVGRPAVRLLS